MQCLPVVYCSPAPEQDFTRVVEIVQARSSAAAARQNISMEVIQIQELPRDYLHREYPDG